MTWTTPMTAVAGESLSASQFNTYVRDNLNETPVAKVTAGGRYFTSDGNNEVYVRRIVSLMNTNTIEIEPGSEYEWVSFGGPSVATVTGTSALIFLGSRMANDNANSVSGVGYSISGATHKPLNRATENGRYMKIDGLNASAGTGNAVRMTAVFLVNDLNPGTNIFEMMYFRHTQGSAWYQRREIIVMPL